MVGTVDDQGVHDAPFVNRERELRRLDGWMSEARQGQLRIVTVSGEPGVGKTSLADEFIRRHRAGATVNASAFQADAGIPFVPLLQALDRPDLVTGDHASANDEQQLVIGRDPRLFVALTDELLRPAATRPTILRLDDVHWADRASADLLNHLLTNAARQDAAEPVRLLALLTARSTTDADDALNARLRQERAHRSLDLGPLDELAVDQLLTQLLGAPPSGRLRADVMEATDGNPLFVRALAQQLRRRGAISVSSGVAVSAEDIGGSGVQLHHVLRHDFDRLSPAAREVVTYASLMDTSVTVDALRVATGMSDDEIDAPLDEAERRGVLRERSAGELEFHHPMMRQLVAGDLSPRSSRALHRDIARRLIDAQHSTASSGQQIIRVAHHLRRAGPRADRLELASYATGAARESVRLGAWTKAARYAELAIDAFGDIDVPRDAPEGSADATLLELHGIAALSHLRNHDPHATEEHCAAAVDIAKRIGDLDAWGEALVLDRRSKLSLRPEALVEALDGTELREFIDVAGSDAPRASAQCWQLLAEMAVMTGGADRDAAERAVESAHEADDDRLLAWAHFADGLTDYIALEPYPAIDKLRIGEAIARQSGEDWVLSALLVRRALAQVMVGDLDAAEEAASEAEVHASRTHNWSEYGMAIACLAQIALARGELPTAERLAVDALALHARSSSPYTAIFAWPTLAYIRLLHADRLGAAQALDDWRTSGVRGSGRFRLLDPFGTDRIDVDLDRYSPASLRPSTVFDGGALVVDVDVALSVGDQELLASVRQRLVELRQRDIELLLPTATSTSRLIAQIDAAIDGQSKTDLDAIANELERRGATLELLRTRIDQVAATSGTAVSTEVVTSLGRELDRRSLLGPLEQLRRAVPVSIGHSLRPQRTVVVWDLVSSTPMLLDAGDEGYVDLVHELNDTIERRLAEYGGLAFKYSGDGVFAWFLDAGAAMRCATVVRDDLHDRNQRDDVTALVIRTGLASGQPVDDDGDLFGLAVVIAARLCDRATPEQILAAAEPGDAADTGMYATAVGPMELKGIAAPVGVIDLSPLTAS